MSGSKPGVLDLMGIYRERILPRLIHLIMRARHLEELRRRCLEDVEGEVLEVGFGSGLNLPFYSSEVRRLWIVEPSKTARKLASKQISSAPFEVVFAGSSGEEIALEDESVDYVVST